jgi:hypothetical protein
MLPRTVTVQCQTVWDMWMWKISSISFGLAVLAYTLWSRSWWGYFSAKLHCRRLQLSYKWLILFCPLLCVAIVLLRLFHLKVCSHTITVALLRDVYYSKMWSTCNNNMCDFHCQAIIKLKWVWSGCGFKRWVWLYVHLKKPSTPWLHHILATPHRHSSNFPTWRWLAGTRSFSNNSEVGGGINLGVELPLHPLNYVWNACMLSVHIHLLCWEHDRYYHGALYTYTGKSDWTEACDISCVLAQ